ncbi:hypothetical protein [Brevibacterium gallinarum]|nr:hypothetical protein [Brevibacterium gallinarum]
MKRETARLTIGWLSPVISAIPRVEYARASIRAPAPARIAATT